MVRVSSLLCILFTGVLLFSCSGNLTELDNGARAYVENIVARITSDWRQGVLMDSIHPQVKPGFELQKVNEHFFLYRKLGTLRQINDIEGRAVVTKTSDNEKIISGIYRVGAEYENGFAFIDISCVLEDEKWYVTGFQVDAPAFDVPAVSGNIDKTENETTDAATLEKQVNQLISTQKPVAIRNDIDRLYALADIYEANHSDENLIELLEKILENNAADLPSRFKLAKVQAENGQLKKAGEQAGLVYQFTEDPTLLEQAGRFLKDHDYPLPSLPEHTGIKSDIEIVMVPVGDVNMQVLYELQVWLQKKMQIHISISDRVVDPGPCDRMGVVPYLKNVSGEIRKSLSSYQHQTLLGELDIQEQDLASVQEQSRYIWKYFSSLGDRVNVYQENYYEQLHRREKMAQYLPGSLIKRIKTRHPFSKNKRIKGYLGVTSKGLYCPECNFIAADTLNAYGIVSYCEFSAAFNNERDNRPRLVNRLLKQALPTVYSMLGIPRCSTPFCPVTYCHSLQEHAAKSDTLCPVCQSRLAQFKEEHVFKMYALSLCSQGRDSLEKGNIDAARWCFHRALEQAVENEAVYGTIGDAYLKTGHFDDAIHAYQTAYKLAPDKNGHLLNTGVAYFQKNQFESALNFFLILLEKNREDPEVLRWVGRCHSKMKNQAEAIPYLQKAIEIEPKHKDQYAYLAGCFYNLKQLDKAVRTWEERIRYFPHDYRGYYNLGWKLAGKNDPKAIENLKIAVELNPELTNAYKLLGESLARTGQMDEAVKIFKQGLETDYRHDNLLNSLGYTYYLKKEYGRAIATYGRALAVNPEFALCHYNQALAHYALRQFDLAKQHLDKSNDLGYQGASTFRKAVYQSAGAL